MIVLRFSVRPAKAARLPPRMPRLILEARRVAATVIHGLHGRRRAGSGENFWQYRRFVSGEPASRVDWRRSARDDHLYVREQEWEAAHTVWIWPDRSPSMAFASPLVRDSKLYRALVVALALAEVLVEGGERVGIPGLMRPTGSRNVIERMAQAIVPRSRRAHEPAADLRALPARRDRAALGPLERRSPTCGARSRSFPVAARAATSCRSSIPPRRPSRIRAASSSSSRKAAAASPPAAPRLGANDYAARVARHRAEIRSRDRPARLELRHPPHRPAGERTAARAARAHRRRPRRRRNAYATRRPSTRMPA